MLTSSLQVLVCPALVLLPALRPGFLGVACCGRLLIVDECLHAHGRPPDRHIRDQTDHTTDVAKRPAVYSMTASPVNTQGKAAGLSILCP